MRIAIYGLPCSGKTYLMQTVKDAHSVHGSEELKRLSPSPFSELSEDNKRLIRLKYVDYVRSLKDDLVISDGHYSFLENVVFTEEDGDVYDAFFYLYCAPETLLSRMDKSEKNKKYASLSPEVIRQWQSFEIESLRNECHRRNKDFYVISDNEEAESVFTEFLSYVKSSFSDYRKATELAEKIMTIFPEKGVINLIDGDKTLIVQDSFRFCCSGKTNVFDGNFYTAYQAFLFGRETHSIDIDAEKIGQVTLNPLFDDVLTNQKYVVLSSGISSIWEDIASTWNIKNVIADTMISADTKFYITKILREAGYKIIAYGDSKIDIYMLREADKGSLCIGEKISRSLKGERLNGINLLYDKQACILAETEDEDILSDIKICKSTSGINGGRLAAAHFRLGQKIGENIALILPEVNTALLVLERGGRFFGDGIYSSFGGTFYSINPANEDIPVISQKRLIIADSVINTGKSTLRMIDKIKSVTPDIDISIAVNVIQEDAVALFNDYKLFAVRVSSNSFVGRNQAKQTGKTGPDTADRLFNIIEERFKVICTTP